MVRSTLALAAALVCTAVANAGPILLNFDTDLDGNPISDGTLVNTAYSPALTGATFSNNAVVVLSGGGVPSQPNFAAGTPLFNGTVQVDFLGGADFVSVTNVTNSNFTLIAFDSGNSLLGSTTLTNFLDVGTLSFGSTPIAYVTLTTTTQYGFDDFSFQITAVPEPATLAVFGAVALAGALGYRRRKAIA